MDTMIERVARRIAGHQDCDGNDSFRVCERDPCRCRMMARSAVKAMRDRPTEAMLFAAMDHLHNHPNDHAGVYIAVVDAALAEESFKTRTTNMKDGIVTLADLKAIVDDLYGSPAHKAKIEEINSRDAVERLRQSIRTASNDDISEPRTEARKRHVLRLEAMRKAISLIEELTLSK